MQRTQNDHSSSLSRILYYHSINRGIKLDIGFSFFHSNLDEIKRSLFPFAPYVHKILGVNGRYKFYNAYPDLGNFSTEDSRLIESLPNAEIYYYTGMQYDKRQVYLDNSEADFLLVLDTDEWIHYVNWVKLYEELEELQNKYPLDQEGVYPFYLFGVDVYFHHGYSLAYNDAPIGGWQTYTRLIRKPREIEYDLTHYTFIHRPNDHKHNWIWTPHYHKLKNLTLQTNSDLRNSHVLTNRDQWALDNMDAEKQNILDAIARGEMK